MRTLTILLIGVLLATAETSAQTVQLESSVGDTAISVVGEVLQRNAYRVLDRDTLLGPEAVIGGDLIVVGSRVTVEGSVSGAVVVLNGEFFVRPRAVVGGPISVLGRGGAFVSGLAASPAPIYADPRNRVEVVQSEGVLLVRVLPPPAPGPIRLPNLFGLALPSYDRVNGLSLGWGPEIRFGGRDTAVVAIRPMVVLRAGREVIDGSLGVSLRSSRRSMITARAGRFTRTADGWIRGTLPNSLSTLLVQSDTRDYFESDELSLTFSRTPPPPLIQGEGFVAPSLTLRASRDRSLTAGDPWSLFTDEDGWRENPAIDEGDLISVVLSALGAWQGPTSTFNGAAAIEWAPGGIGDYEFAQLSLNLRYGMQALWNHQIAVAGYYLQPIGGQEAPLQRWTHVGGSGTLPTLRDAAMRGDHALFVESIYLIPLTGIRLPVIGEPGIRLEHAVGGAWRSSDPFPRFVQNLGAGLQVNMFNALVVTDPAAEDLPFRLRLGAEIPGGAGVAGFPFF